MRDAHRTTTARGLIIPRGHGELERNHIADRTEIPKLRVKHGTSLSYLLPPLVRVDALRAQKVDPPHGLRAVYARGTWLGLLGAPCRAVRAAVGVLPGEYVSEVSQTIYMGR